MLLDVAIFLLVAKRTKAWLGPISSSACCSFNTYWLC